MSQTPSPLSLLLSLILLSPFLSSPTPSPFLPPSHQSPLPPSLPTSLPPPPNFPNNGLITCFMIGIQLLGYDIDQLSRDGFTCIKLFKGLFSKSKKSNKYITKYLNTNKYLSFYQIQIQVLPNVKVFKYKIF